MLGRPAWYKKLKQQTFKNNSDRFRTNLDQFMGVLGFPVETLMKADTKSSEIKRDFFFVLLTLLLIQP